MAHLAVVAAAGRRLSLHQPVAAERLLQLPPSEGEGGTGEGRTRGRGGTRGGRARGRVALEGAGEREGWHW